MDHIPITRLVQKFNNNLHYRFLCLTYNNQHWHTFFIKNNVKYIFKSYYNDEENNFSIILNINPADNNTLNFSKYVPYMVDIFIKLDVMYYLSEYKQFNKFFNINWFHNNLIRRIGDPKDPNTYLMIQEEEINLYEIGEGDFENVVLDFFHYKNFSLVRKIIKMFNIDMSKFEGDIPCILNHFNCPKSYIKFMCYYNWDIYLADDHQYVQWYEILDGKINKLVYNFIVNDMCYTFEDDYLINSVDYSECNLKFLYFITKRNYSKSVEESFIYYIKYLNNDEEHYYMIMKIFSLIDKEIVLKYNEHFKKIIEYLGY